MLMRNFQGGDGSPRTQSPTPPLAPQQGGLLAVPGGPSRDNSLDKLHSDGGDTPFPSSPADSPRVYENHEDEDPLKPDPGTETDFQVDNNVFAFSPGQLSKLNSPKNIAALRALGGIEGLAIGLRTDLKAGLSLDETTLEGTVSFADATGGANKFAVAPDPSVPKRVNTVAAKPAAARLHPDSYKDRLRVFGDNRLPERKSQSLLRLMWITLNDKVLLLLSGAAAISLALGLFQTFGVKHDPNEGAPVDWVEGVAIMVAIAIVVIVGAGNDYQKERQFVKLNKKVSCRVAKPYPPPSPASLRCDADFVIRKRIALLKSSVLESPWKSRFSTYWWVMFVTWSLEISFPPTASSLLVTISSATSLPQPVNPTR